MQKIKLAILYGGPGGEHEVSIKSAKNILENLNREKYEVKEFFLGKNVNTLSKKIIIELKSFLVWPIFHGEFGEGGLVQEILEKNKIKFIGSGSKSSKLAIDKFKTQKVLEKNKILCPKSFLVDKTDLVGGAQRRPKLSVLLKKVNFPLILKPVNSGSSVDLYKVKNEKEFERDLKKILKNYKQVLLQEFITGREFTCGVLQKGKTTIALPVSEVILNGQDVFDYNAKYATKGLEITPAKIDDKLKDKIQSFGKKVHKIIGCSGVTRTDMILSRDNKLYVLEINTIPGLTKVSFVPEQLKSANISIPKFIDILVTNHK
jgi:D-alanine-D-alanine ligase